MHTLLFRSLTAAFCGAALVACGGSSTPLDGQQTATDGTRLLASVYSSRAAAATTPATTPGTVAPTTTLAPAVVSTSTITDIRLENTTPAVAQSNVPFTFGQVFAAGHLPAGTTLSGRLDDGSTVPLQLDIKATHPDGSVRHAVVSGIAPSLKSATQTLSLVQGSAATGAEVSPSVAINSGFTASVNATINGVRYTASADALLKSGKFTKWLSGPVANEWHVSAPLTTSAGVAHPHLAARFAIRWYDRTKQARVDVTVENNWAYEEAPGTMTYDAQVLVGGKAVYTQAGLQHYHHARWRKLFWYGGAEPAVHVKHNTKYLIGTQAVPNYDQTIAFTESHLASWQTRWTAAKTAPMNTGLAVPYMPGTGGRNDLGLMPGWTATYLLTMDKRLKAMTLGSADLAGSWSSHYRDRNTGQPISLMDYPYMTILGQSTDTRNPATGKYEAFPKCPASGVCKTPNTHDTSHQPAFAYFPYLVTGDHYYLEELQFWAMYSAFSSNPGYRKQAKGLVQSDQVRGQAWSLRTLSEAAYITPDKDRLKSHFASIVKSNLDWYNTNYTNNTAANPLGALAHGYAIVYQDGLGVGPWQDDFFTSAVGHAAELGFAEAKSLLAWKSKFPIQRMTASGACWVDGAQYSMKIRDSKTSAVYATMAQVYKANHTAELLAMPCGGTQMATALKLKLGEMTGYSSNVTGYPSNMQPALAYAANAGGTAGANAWKVFMARSVKPNYAASPQFAIVPR
ncbi:hypothetical protein [Massilia niastensis]|uniref:RIFT barrel domain-containing protein n=1 Tax=Massilia niastensis TaxID=544911 RepID=UPI0009FEF075|nr:hypothetical protein [Massilia niastensis]